MQNKQQGSILISLIISLAIIAVIYFIINNPNFSDKDKISNPKAEAQKQVNEINKKTLEYQKNIDKETE